MNESTATEHPSTAYLPLAAEAWSAWTCERYGLRVERIRFGGESQNSALLDVQLYLDKSGRVRMPPLDPYLAVRFRSTPTGRRASIERQWLDLGGQLAAHLADRGLSSTVCLPPGIFDARPFTWHGFEATISYTYRTDLPIDETTLDPSVRKNVRKAQKAGHQVESSSDWAEVHRCLLETEEAKRFRHGVTTTDLRDMSQAVGEDFFRTYVVRDDQGLVRSAGVRLHEPGGTALDLFQGTHRDSLRLGVNQLMYRHALEDLTSAGAGAFDNVGANIRAVAAAKGTWGFELTPYLVLSAPGPRTVGHSLRRAALWRTGRTRSS